MTKQATQFVAPSGKVFVYLTDMPFQDGQVLFSPDGVTFYELASRGFGGTTIEHDLSFDDPHQGVSGKLHRNGDVIDYDGERYTQQNVTFDQSSVVPLPATRRTEYLCQAEDGTLFYVSAGEYNYSYDSFKLFVGDGTTMSEVPIDHSDPLFGGVQRLRDGGTTSIKTSDGSFYAPQRRYPEPKPKRPTWTSGNLVIELTFLNPNDFDIVESPEGEVSITKR